MMSVCQEFMVKEKIPFFAYFSRLASKGTITAKVMVNMKLLFRI